MPTFKQLQARHPDAVMKWFAKGRLWNSEEEAHAAQRGGERRKPDWRPGGEHRDPRARFDIPRDEKRRRFAAKLRRERTDAVGRDSDATRDHAARPPRRDFRREDREQRGPRFERKDEQREPRFERKDEHRGPRFERKDEHRGPRFERK